MAIWSPLPMQRMTTKALPVVVEVVVITTARGVLVARVRGALLRRRVEAGPVVRLVRLALPVRPLVILMCILLPATVAAVAAAP